MADADAVPSLMDGGGGMARLRGGRWYDTDGLDCVASYRSGVPGEPEFVEEELYRTEDGAFFLIGRGGSRSEWGVHLCTTVDGEAVRDMSRKSAAKNLRALSDADAAAWEESHA